MIKKIEIGMVAVLFILCIIICVSLKMKNTDKIYPSDVVYDFFTEMTSGNFDVAMSLYLDEYKDNQMDVLNGNMDLYKSHWANLGIEIDSETYNDNEGTATCVIDVSKYNIEQIVGDVNLRLADIKEVKEDGTTITIEEINALKKQYIKEAYQNAAGKIKVVRNTYTLKLVADDENDSWKIVNDKSISDILFGNVSDEDKNKAITEETKTKETKEIENKEERDMINNDIIG